MSMTFRKIVLVLLCLAAFSSRGPAQGITWSPIPITDLASRADLIVLATLDDSNNSDPSALTASLQVASVLKGQPPSLTVAVQRTLRPGDVSRGVLLQNGATGIWFLKVDSPGYQILALASGMARSSDLFVSVSASQNMPAGTINQQLLGYAVNMYRANPNPLGFDDRLLLASLEPRGTSDVSPADQLAAANILVTSTSPNAHRIGLIAALRLSSPEAMAIVGTEAANLSQDPRFGLITEALRDYPKDTSWIPVLQQTAAAHSDPPILDGAVAAALTKIGTQAVLPALALLLDSKDPQAQRTAAWYFSKVSVFASSNGTIRDSGPAGPFSTAETRSYSPPNDSITPAQYAAFWKAWWTENKQQLGF